MARADNTSCSRVGHVVSALVMCCLSSCGQQQSHPVTYLFSHSVFPIILADEVEYSGDCLVMVNPRMPFYDDLAAAKTAALGSFRGKTWIGIRGRREALFTELGLKDAIANRTTDPQGSAGSNPIAPPPRQSLELQSSDYQIVQIRPDGGLNLIATKAIRYCEVQRRSSAPQ